MTSKNYDVCLSVVLGVFQDVKFKARVFMFNINRFKAIRTGSYTLRTQPLTKSTVLMQILFFLATVVGIHREKATIATAG